MIKENFPLVDEYKKHLIGLEYSSATTKTYLRWCRQFFEWHGIEDEAQLCEEPLALVERFSDHLCTKKGYSTVSQKAVISALASFYRVAFKIEIMRCHIHRKGNRQTSYTKDELVILFSFLNFETSLFFKLMYSTGLRTGDLFTLRINDVDTERNFVYANGRIHPLAICLTSPMNAWIEHLKPIVNGVKHGQDPYLFPQHSLECGYYNVPHVESRNQFSKALRLMAETSGMNVRLSPRHIRNTFAICLLQAGETPSLLDYFSGRATREAMGHITKGIQAGTIPIRSPLDMELLPTSQLTRET